MTKSLLSIPVINVEATSENLKHFREKHSITVAQLQKLFNMENPQSIYVWEDSKKKVLPRLDNLVVLAKLYNVSIDELIIVENITQDCTAVREPCPPFGISQETLTFIRQKSSKKVLSALGCFFNCDFF